MIINAPKPEDIPRLRRLWQQAFGDTDAFLDDFFALAFSPDRCRCVWEQDRLGAMLYWFDCQWDGQRIAYLYAVATDAAFQNRGLCRALMENTHAHLAALGYDSAMLVPGSRSLFGYYERLGYRTATYVREFVCHPAGDPIDLRPLTAAEYARLRRQLLPQGGVAQEDSALALLEAQSGLYAGEGILLVAALDGKQLVCSEFLGPAGAAPGILAALGAEEGHFRVPGGDTPFAMHLPLRRNAQPPAYFGLALD